VIKSYNEERFRVDLGYAIKGYEGLRLKPYRCIKGVLTIGYGRNLEANGISLDEAEYLFQNDLRVAIEGCRGRIEFFKELPVEAQKVLVNMAFQLGVEGLLKFKKTLQYLEQRDFASAADEMLDSHWARETPGRARELSDIIRAL